MQFLTRLSAVASVVLAAAACTGSVPNEGKTDKGSGGSGSSGATTPSGTAGSGTSTPDDNYTTSAVAGPMPVRRLTRNEYNHAVRDLLGDKSNPADGWPVELPSNSGFVTAENVGSVELARIQDSADTTSINAVSNNWARIFPCPTGAAQESCVTNFIETFGRNAFRRKLTADEKAEHLALYKTLVGAPISMDLKTAIQTLISAMLQSPRFLYHWEVASDTPLKDDNGVVDLTLDQVASRLSFFLWSSVPDSALYEAVDSAALANPAEIEKQARRMLKDPKARDSVVGFYRQVLELDKLDSAGKDQKLYPTYSADLVNYMNKEMDAFTAWAVLQDGKLETLLTSPTAFVEQRLAKLYGYSGDAPSGVPLKQVTLDATQRPGLLTRAGFLAAQSASFESSPIKRGKIILFRFLCGSVPPPPANVDQMPKPARPNPQTREKFEDHENNPSCAACHKAMDPLGFAFESYDAIGAYRSLDAGRPVNTTGTYSVDDKDVSFAGASELLHYLAKSAQAQTCATKQWLHFALGRELVDGDDASVASATKTATAGGYDMREAMIALSKSTTFLRRTIAQGEVLQ